MALGGGQKFCLGVILLAALTLIAGSAAPYWMKLSGNGVKYGYGLWFFCQDSDCEVYQWTKASFGDFSSWFYVVHATGGLATLLSLIVTLVSLVKLCGNPQSATSAGVLALLAGLLGCATAAVFYLKQAQSLALVVSDEDWDWAFVVFSVGTSLLTVFSLVLLCLPKSNNAVGSY